MRRVLGVTLIAAALAAVPPTRIAAQDPAAPQVQPDPLFDALFAPELIMQHRRAINLTDQQRDQISRMIGELQGRVVQMQWELLDEMEQLTQLMRAPRVDLDRAMDQLDNVLEREKEIKQAHLNMLVRIKNLLTPEQQATLERLRSQAGAQQE